MHSRSRLLFVVLLLVVGTLALPWAASAQEPVTSRLKLSIGGYVKGEMMYRTASGGVAFAGAIPGQQNFGFVAVAQPNTLAHDNGQFTANANETRFNFTMTAPDWRGLKPTAFIEFDSQGDTASTIERFCPAGTICAATQQSGNLAGSINNGGFRIRHAFFRLSGEGLGGSYELTLGQTWGIFGMVPYYAGSTLSFGGATIFGQRQPQLSLRHTIRFFRDFAWETAIGAMSDTTNLNETPAGDISGRFIYSGWQGWQGGGRAPTSIGVSARIQRQKADLFTGGPAPTAVCVQDVTTEKGVPLIGGNAPPSSGGCVFTGLSPGPPGDGAIPGVTAAPLAAAGSSSTPTRSLSAAAWGITGGIFLPILPGTSATDRTWALSVVSEGGYGEGVNTIIPGTNPHPAAVTVGANERADPGAAFFNPGGCNLWFGPGPSSAFAAGTQTSNAGMSLTPAAAAACNNGNRNLGPGALIPTRLSLTKTPWVSWNAQFYLPWNFWLSGGQKYIWYTNADNAVAQTCVNGVGVCGAAIAGTGLVTPVSQGRFNTEAFNVATGAKTINGATTNNTTVLFTSRDSLVKRQTYNYVALFYDMTPNIRWGFEWGMHGTNRKDSAQDAQSHRWQFGAYYFF